MSIDIRLKRLDRIFNPGELVSGVVVVTSPRGGMTHSGLSLLVEGSVSLQLSARSVGLFEAFYSSIKPIQLFNYTIEINPGGRLPEGVTEFPFEFELKAFEGKSLVETYHGVYVNIQYMLTADMQRPMLAKNLKKSLEFIVETLSSHRPAPTPVPFEIIPESLENVKKTALSNIPRFRIRGLLDSAFCCITKPFTGFLAIEESQVPIKSVELQLVRVETCGYADGVAREATEIQNIQLADGDVIRSFQIPIYMIFPRLFTCPTTITKNFKIEFEVNLVILFTDGHMITENFPIKTYR